MKQQTQIKDVVKNQEFFADIPENISRRRLFEVFKESWNVFKKDFDLATLNNIYGSEERGKSLKYPVSNLDARLKKTNKKYREVIMGRKENFNQVSMVVLSHNGNKFKDILGDIFNFKFLPFKNKTVIAFTKEKFEIALRIAYAFLFAKYDTVYKFQLEATFQKILIEFFNPATYEINVIEAVFNKSLGWLLSDINALITQFGLKQKKIRLIANKNKITSFPTKEQYIKWLKTYSHTELKEILAKQYKCSTKTIQRDMAQKGVTRTYNKEKKE